MERKISRGDVYYADLNPVLGSEQGGIRPVVVVQNNVGNRHSPTVIVVAIIPPGCKNTASPLTLSSTKGPPGWIMIP